MDIPYGFDCYTFRQNEVKYFESNILRSKWDGIVPYSKNLSALEVENNFTDPNTGLNLPGFIRFTRKNEYYPQEQINELTKAGRLNEGEALANKQIFCGIKIQIGIGVVTNFLQKGLQYRKPNKGRGEFINGTWTGIVSGLTVDKDAPHSYDMAFGNFLAYDEEFPYMKFGPFFAIESKLVMLTGSTRRVETSSFGTNIDRQIWITALIALILLSLVASIRSRWQYTKYLTSQVTINELKTQRDKGIKTFQTPNSPSQGANQISQFANLVYLMQNFFFIYFTMLLNKPSVEFDDLIWPKHKQNQSHNKYNYQKCSTKAFKHQRSHHIQTLEIYKAMYKVPFNNEEVETKLNSLDKRKKRKSLPTSIRVVSYLWSAACLVLASIYSGEMIAVILLRTDQNIDTISQLIGSKPQIEPVIRQDDFTYNLMLKSLDRNMLILHNMTKIIPRPEVYTRRFIEGVSERKQALLGDDELIETIYDIYHKYFSLHRSQVSYLQYPISIMYRMDLNHSLEMQLRRGIVQIFEMGLVHRWYQAQKDTYIHFYDTYERKDHAAKDKELADSTTSYNHGYKPLSMQNFQSMIHFMLLWLLGAFIVLALEILYFHLTKISRNLDEY